MPYGAIVDTVAGCYNAWCDVVADTVDSVLDDAIAVWDAMVSHDL